MKAAPLEVLDEGDGGADHLVGNAQVVAPGEVTPDGAGVHADADRDARPGRRRRGPGRPSPTSRCLPGLMRSPAAPRRAASTARRWSKCTSATTGMGLAAHRASKPARAASVRNGRPHDLAPRLRQGNGSGSDARAGAGRRSREHRPDAHRRTPPSVTPPTSTCRCALPRSERATLFHRTTSRHRYLRPEQRRGVLNHHADEQQDEQRDAHHVQRALARAA